MGKWQGHVQKGILTSFGPAIPTHQNLTSALINGEKCNIFLPCDCILKYSTDIFIQIRYPTNKYLKMTPLLSLSHTQTHPNTH